MEYNYRKGECSKGGVKILGDARLIQRILNGERDLFEIIMRRYNEVLYRVIRSYFSEESEVEDLMQETYIKAYQKLFQFRKEAKFSTWLVRIGINEALQRQRRLKKQRTVSFVQEADLTQVIDTSFMNPENKTIHAESVAFLEKAIDHLPEKYKIIYMLREVEGLGIAEISKCLDLSESNVKVRVHRAKIMIKDYLIKSTDIKNAFEFGNSKCDRLVDEVMKKIHKIELGCQC